MKVRLILFDFDYTLVDASQCLFPALRKGLAAIGIHDEIADKTLRALIGIPLQEQFRKLAPARANDFVAFERAYISERSLRESEGTQVLPGIISALERLKHSGLRLGIVSTGAQGRIRRTLDRLGALSLIGQDAIVGGAADKAQGIQQGFNHFHCGKDETLYVGDRPDDCAAARGAGTRFIGTTTGAFGKNAFPEDCVVLASVAALPEYLTSTALC